MDDINAFIGKLEVEFDEIEKGRLIPSLGYKDMEGWSSMKALILIATIDSEYGILLNGEDISKASTLQDIYDIVKSKRNNKIT